MASRTATVVGCVLAKGHDSVGTSEVLKTYHLYLQNNTSSTVIGGTDTLDCDVSSSTSNILDRLHSGQTVTLIDAHVAENALVGTTEYWGTVGLSTNTIQITPKAVSDYSSNATLPANTTATNRPYMVSVTVKVA